MRLVPLAAGDRDLYRRLYTCPDVMRCIGTPLTIVVSLAAALLLNSRVVKLRPVWRVALFAPYVTTLVATAVVWRYLLHTRYGAINAGLGEFGIPPIDWLGDPNWAMPSIILLSVWKNFGYNMLVFLAGLSSIPEELYEAAALDGAGAWHRLRHITLPTLKTLIRINFIGAFIGAFHATERILVMTAGGREYRVNYLPAESDTGMFGGNSNWRGPIWMPVNALIIRALLQYYTYYGDAFTVDQVKAVRNQTN